MKDSAVHLEQDRRWHSCYLWGYKEMPIYFVRFESRIRAKLATWKQLQSDALPLHSIEFRGTQRFHWSCTI